MNFKNIKKILKKNYKKIIVVCLIMLLLSNKMYEKFTTAQALDAVKSTEKKVNDMFYTVDKNWNKSSKGIYGKKSIEAEGNVVSRKGNVSAKVDLIAGRNVNAASNVNAKKDVNANRLCLGGTCITKAHLDILTGKRHFFMANKDKNRFLKQEGNTNSWKAEWKGSWADPMKRLFIYTSKGRSEPNT